MAVTLTSTPDDLDPAPAPASAAPESARARLGSRLPGDRFSSWLWAGLVTGIALVLRLVNLDYPPGKIFDEVYYAKDAADLLRYGVEQDTKTGGPAFVAHPPLGKWFIALGEQLFGNNAFGWRIAAAVAGALSVLVLVRVARRMFGSTLLGCVAGLLLALDGLHFVSSRVALLDIFLMLLILVAFACLLLNRDARRGEFLQRLESGQDLRKGADRRLGTVPWWLFAAGIVTGLALGVKWSALWFALAFAGLAFVWEARARKSAGVRHPWWDTIGRDLGWTGAFFGFVLLAHLATWTGWFLTDSGWDRNWAATTGNSIPLVPDALTNLWHYQKAVYDFHSGLNAKHDYQSTPWSWLFLGRPVAYYYTGEGDCGADRCAAHIVALGNPLLWWSFVPALLASAWGWLARRDWRAGAILACVAAGLLPWTFYPDRTMFLFYTLPALPFLVLAVTYALGMVLGPAGADRERKILGVALVGLSVLVIAMAFAYFYPVYTGEVLPYDDWKNRMWFDSWI